MTIQISDVREPPEPIDTVGQVAENRGAGILLDPLYAYDPDKGQLAYEAVGMNFPAPRSKEQSKRQHRYYNPTFGGDNFYSLILNSKQTFTILLWFTVHKVCCRGSVKDKCNR